MVRKLQSAISIVIGFSSLVLITTVMNMDGFHAMFCATAKGGTERHNKQRTERIALP